MKMRKRLQNSIISKRLRMQLG